MIFPFLTTHLLLLLPCVIQGSETVYDAARLARNLVDNSPNAIGVIATNYPRDHSTLPGEPFALQEYYSSCFINGSLALLMFSISQSTINIFHESNPFRNATLTIQDPQPTAAHPRVALIGTVTRVAENLFESEGIEDCFIGDHPDASNWIPAKWGAHASFWARFDPHAIYYVGGFGGLHFIGFIPPGLYQASGSDHGHSYCNERCLRIQGS